MLFRPALTLLMLAASCQTAATETNGRSDTASWQLLLVAGVGYEKIEVIDRDGTSLWSLPQRGDRHVDAWMLPGGDIITSGGSDGLAIIAPDYAAGSGGSVVWKRGLSKAEAGEVHACQPLGDDRFLIGESYNQVSYILEIDRDGNEHVRVPIHGLGNKHRSFRTIRKTPAGTYLVQGQYDRKAGLHAMEVDASGTVLNRYPGGQFHIFRLPNGNTLMSSGQARSVIDGRYVLEVDPAGAIVWSLSRDELPGITFVLAGGMQRLSNGNTLICNWDGHEKGAEGPAIFEVTPDKTVVWRAPEHMPRRATSIMVVDELLEVRDGMLVPVPDPPVSVVTEACR